MIHVENFAKDTGDWKSLSKVDLQVIALGVRLAKEKGEIDNIKKEPQPLTEFRPDNFNSDACVAGAAGAFDVSAAVDAAGTVEGGLAGFASAARAPDSWSAS